MKKLILFYILLSASIFGQTYRFIYQVEYKKDSVDNFITKENRYLDINSNESFYYERPYFVSDSIFKATKVMAYNGKPSDILIKNFKTKEYSTITHTGFDGFILKDIPLQNWTILKDIKYFNNVKVQKAETKWEGRNWTAWFDPEIPFQEGPYKFNGLPGLIVELYDNKNNFNFKLIKSESLTEDFVLDFYKNIKNSNFLIEIPDSKFKKMQLEYYQTPMKAAHDGTFNITKTPIITDYGTKISTDRELRIYENKERVRIKKYNNPIELDKIIHYP